LNLKEYQGKKLFKKFAIPIPKGKLINKNKPLSLNVFNQLKTEQVVLKAQVPFGKRGKSGGIIFTGKNNFKHKTQKLFSKTIQGFKVNQIWVEEKIDIVKEFYLSITLSRNHKDYLLVFSPEGGIEIEEIAEKHPNKIIKMPLKSGWQNNFAASCQNFNLNNKIVKNIIGIGRKLFKLTANDINLAEINPLVLTKNNRLIAADAKLTLDDNALFRHKQYRQKKQSNAGLEQEAKQIGLAYVHLEGDIGIIGNGAGLVMCSLDTIAHFGGSPANFLDIGGGADRKKMAQAIKIVLKNPKCRSLFINIFGGITKCDEVAQGITDCLKQTNQIPIVVRLVGTNEKRGQKILKKVGLHFYKDMELAAKKAVKVSQGE